MLTPVIKELKVFLNEFAYDIQMHTNYNYKKIRVIVTNYDFQMVHLQEDMLKKALYQR